MNPNAKCVFNAGGGTTTLMPTQSESSAELSEEELVAINDVIRESGVYCTGMRDGYLLISTRGESSREDLAAVAEDVSELLSDSAEDVAEIVRQVRARTLGVALTASD